MSRLLFRLSLLPALILPALIACTSAGSDGTSQSGGTYPGYPGAGGNHEPLPGAAMRCFYGPGDPNVPAATVEHVLEIVEGVEAVHVRLTLDPRFVDNTYGDGSIGWGTKAHTFEQLVKSDHAQFRMFDRADALALDFRIDYISADVSALSGYASLGISGGDGELARGDASTVLGTTTSLDRNLNERGYSSFIDSSPLTDSAYTPNSAAANWDYRVVYEVRVANDAFAGGFKTAEIEYIHASPAKDGDTIVVEPEPCPPDWGCNDPDGCENDPNPPPVCNDPDGCENDPNTPECTDPNGCDTDPVDPECTDPDGCDNTPTPPSPEPECTNDEDCGPTEFCAEEGTCLPYVN